MTDPRLIHHVDQLRAAIVEVAGKWLTAWALDRNTSPDETQRGDTCGYCGCEGRGDAHRVLIRALNKFSHEHDGTWASVHEAAVEIERLVAGARAEVRQEEIQEALDELESKIVDVPLFGEKKQP